MNESTYLNVSAPSLVCDLHLQLQNLVLLHEVMARLILLPNMLVQEVQQAHHGLVVLYC